MQTLLLLHIDTSIYINTFGVEVLIFLGSFYLKVPIAVHLCLEYNTITTLKEILGINPMEIVLLLNLCM